MLNLDCRAQMLGPTILPEADITSVGADITNVGADITNVVLKC